MRARPIPGKPDPMQRTRHRANLLKAASRFARVFELAAPDAPGLVALGAEFDPSLADPLHAGQPLVGVSGVGLSLQDAFQGCIGEGIEYLSQLQTADDVLEPDPGDSAIGLGPQTREFLAAFAAHRVDPDADLSWHRVRRLIDGRELLLPADLCLRRPPSRQEVRPPFPLSTGSAAGRSWDAAALHGLLEVIERDAAGLWWQGGNRGKAIPPGHEAQVTAETLLARLRQGAFRAARLVTLISRRISACLRCRGLLRGGWFRRCRWFGRAADTRGCGPFGRSGNVPGRTGPCRGRSQAPGARRGGTERAGPNSPAACDDVERRPVSAVAASAGPARTSRHQHHGP